MVLMIKILIWFNTISYIFQNARHYLFLIYSFFWFEIVRFFYGIYVHVLCHWSCFSCRIIIKQKQTYGSVAEDMILWIWNYLPVGIRAFSLFTSTFLFISGNYKERIIKFFKYYYYDDVLMVVPNIFPLQKRNTRGPLQIKWYRQIRYLGGWWHLELFLFFAE